MRTRYATVVRTGARVAASASLLPELYRRARALGPGTFLAEETRTLEPLYAFVPLAWLQGLRDEAASLLALPAGVFSLDRFAIYGCGPISRHDDRHNYPGVYFVIVVAHPGRLGVVDTRMRAARHEPGEILLLDPYRKHALVPEGRTAAEHPYERTHSPVLDERDQFLFLSLDVRRRDLRERFRIPD